MNDVKNLLDAIPWPALLVNKEMIVERVLTREFLLDRIWPDNLDIETRTVDVHLARLRKSLKLAGKSHPIRTVRGVGYSIQLI